MESEHPLHTLPNPSSLDPPRNHNLEEYANAESPLRLWSHPGSKVDPDQVRVGLLAHLRALLIGSEGWMVSSREPAGVLTGILAS